MLACVMTGIYGKATSAKQVQSLAAIKKVLTVDSQEIFLWNLAMNVVDFSSECRILHFQLGVVFVARGLDTTSTSSLGSQHGGVVDSGLLAKRKHDFPPVRAGHTR